MEESFFDVIADLIFEQPQQYLGSVLQRAYKMELRERNPRLMPEEGGSQDEPNIDEPGIFGRLNLHNRKPSNSYPGLLQELPQPKPHSLFLQRVHESWHHN